MKPASRNLILALASIVLLGGCAGMVSQKTSSNSASVLTYLFQGDTTKATMKPEMANLKIPLRIGLAFVPGSLDSSGVSEAEQIALLKRVKEAFLAYPFVKEIQVVPSTYLTRNGGFENLDQVSRLFDLDVITLLSYDQVQFTDSSRSSVLYWTLIGAYIVNGDQYDIHTLLEASVFDIPSRKLLFRAPGTAKVQGAGSMVNFSERARAGRVEGFNKAIEDLIPNLKQELEGFRVRARAAAGAGGVNIIRPPGYVDPPPIK